MNTIYFNEKYMPENEAYVSVFDRSYLFGEGLFETFRSYNGKFPLLKSHLARLEWSCVFAGFEFPLNIDFEKICSDLLEKNKFKDARFKVVLSLGPKKDTPHTALPVEAHLDLFQTNVIVFCEKLLDAADQEPCRLKVIINYHNDSLPLVAMKTTNYLLKMRARMVAKEAGYYDGILTNVKGNVTETTSANIFWVDKDSQLHTVMDDQGLLSGIMRKFVIDLLEKNKISVRQGVISPKELSHAKEIFITNSVIGVKPVVAIDDRQISGGEAGDITLMIGELVRKNV